MTNHKYIPGLAARVLHQITEHPETWDQEASPRHWVPGEPTCVGGVILLLAGDLPIGPDADWTDQAAIRVGDEAKGTPWRPGYPFGWNYDPRPWLGQLAARDEYLRARSGGMGNGFCSALMEVARG